jgi:O-antigen/teichoic acid export membrane protein
VAVVLTAVKAHANLPVLILGVAAVQPLVSLLNGCAFFGFQYPHLRPRLQDFHWATAQRLLGTGFWFFLVSILAALGIYSDNVVVAHVVGLKTVPLYAVPASLAGYLGAVASMLYTPFWAANGEALARGDIAWVRHNTTRILKLNVLITGTAGLAFVIAGPVFLHWWIAPDFSPGRLLFAGMAAWALLISAAGPFFMVLNGANAVRVQVLMFGVFSVVAITLKIILARRIGIAGVVWASVVPYAFLVVPALLWAMRRVMQRANNSLQIQGALSELPLPPARVATTGSQW